MFKVGVISDTHNFLDPKIPKLFSGVDYILHGGDIGQARIILELEELAPVSAVIGNTDDSGLRFRVTEVLTLAEKKFFIHHIVNPHALDETLQRRISTERPDVIVFGHTHKQFVETINGTLFFNPGYAGKPRFGMPRSVAILQCDGNGIRPEFLLLE